MNLLCLYLSVILISNKIDAKLTVIAYNEGISNNIGDKDPTNTNYVVKTVDSEERNGIDGEILKTEDTNENTRIIKANNKSDNDIDANGEENNNSNVSIDEEIDKLDDAKKDDKESTHSVEPAGVYDVIYARFVQNAEANMYNIQGNVIHGYHGDIYVKNGKKNVYKEDDKSYEDVSSTVRTRNHI